jgi:AcrB/AcrD/AcrF family
MTERPQTYLRASARGVRSSCPGVMPRPVPGRLRRRLVHTHMINGAEFPILARSPDHHHGVTRGAIGRPMDALSHPHHAQGPGPDGGHHEHRGATSDSILLITFANERRQEGHEARSAALSAGFTRLRPVPMTALVMLIGMLPMSLGLGEGGSDPLLRDPPSAAPSPCCSY